MRLIALVPRVAVPLALLGLSSLILAAVFGLYLAADPLIRFYQGGSEGFKRELKRKAFHQLTLLYLGAYFLFGYPLMAWLMTGWTGLALGIDLLRLKVPRARPFFDYWFGRIVRSREASHLSGAFYTSAGVLATVALFGRSPALVAAGILALAWGDAVSPLVGLRFGFRPYKVMGTRRSVDGTVAGFSVAFLIALAAGFSPWIALGAAAAFSVVDTVPVKPNDNLWIPVVFSAALFLLGRMS